MIGLSVIVKTKEQFDKIKDFLTEDVLYFDWVPQMQEKETGIVLMADRESKFSSGSVGSTEYQKQEGIICMKFEQFHKHINYYKQEKL